MGLKSSIYRYFDKRLPHLTSVVLQRGDDGKVGNDQGGVVDGIVETYCKRLEGLVTFDKDNNVTDDGVDRHNRQQGLLGGMGGGG